MKGRSTEQRKREWSFLHTTRLVNITLPNIIKNSQKVKKLWSAQYSEIPLLRPPKIKTFYPLKTLFAKFR